MKINNSKLLFVFSICALLLNADNLSDAKSKATIGASSASNKFNSKTKIKQNALNPMQGQGSVTNIEGSSSFSAPIVCFEKAPGVETSYIVSPSSFSVSIKQDTNMDKYFDYTKSFSSIVGVCQNGFVTGNWESPSYNKIIISNGKISSIPVEKKDVFGCFCTSSSCSYTFDAGVYNTFDGAINAVLVSANINISGDNEWDSISQKTTTYYNYKTSCGSGSIGSNGTDPRNNYASQSTPDLSGYLSGEAKKSDSIYSAAKTHSQTTIPISGNTMAVNYRALNECYIHTTPTWDGMQIILTKVDTCSSYKSSCSVKTIKICDNLGNNCEQTFFNGSTSLQTKTFCYTTDLNQEPFSVCDKPLQGVVLSSASINKTFSNEHLYVKYVYDCGIKASSADLTQSNNINTDGKGSFNYKDGSNGKIVGLPSSIANSCLQQYCTIKKTVSDTDVHSDNTTDNSTRNQMAVKVCVQNISGTFSCPVESGDIIVDNCTCQVPSTLSSRALGELKAVEEVINDFTCSTL